MDELVIDHSYRLGMAWDSTHYRNHGVLHGISAGSGYFNGSFSFEPGRSHPGSAVVVPPAKSLARIGALRVRARIRTTPLGGGGNRQNIVEGDHSFAFFINPNLSLQGTFLSPGGTWDGIATAPMAVMPNQTYDVEFRYDGISHAEIRVDGNVRASSYDSTSLTGPPVVGPVRGVGPYGVWVGHWPVQDDRYTFHGYIWAVQVWKRDEVKDLLGLFDRCCIRDLDELHKAGERLGAKGFTVDDGKRILDRLVEMGSGFAATARGDTQAEADVYDHAVRQVLTAMRSGGPVGPAMRDALELILERVDPDVLTNLADEAQGFMGDLPVSQDEVFELGRHVCLGDLPEQVKDLVNDIQKSRKKPQLFEERRRGGRK